MKVWAIVDKDENKEYILVNYDNEGNPRLNVFDWRHKDTALQMLDKWKETSHHSTARLIECEITI